MALAMAMAMALAMALAMAKIFYLIYNSTQSKVKQMGYYHFRRKCKFFGLQIDDAVLGILWGIAYLF